MKCIFICIIGIDGSGKTTFANKLNNELNKDGIESQYVYGRVIPVISRVLMWAGRKFILKKKKSDIFDEYNKYTSQKNKLLKNSFFSIIFIWSLLFDQIIQANIKIKPILSKKKVVICDRYILDTVITDIAANLYFSKEKITTLTKRVFKFTPIPNIIFLLDVSEEIAFKRKDDVPHINYLKERRNLYLDLVPAFQMEIVDGNKNLNELYNDVLKKLNTKFGEIKNG